MELIRGELPDKEAKKFDFTVYAQILRKLRNLLRGMDLYSETHTLKDTPEAAVPEPDLEDVHLRYIPDYIRELRTKKDYWKKEFLYWNDIISYKNWKKYDEKVKYHVYRHKDVLQGLDNLVESRLEDKNYFTQSLDPKRVQDLVTAIKETESEDNPFEVMLKAVEADNVREWVQFSYILYAIYATYPMNSS